MSNRYTSSTDFDTYTIAVKKNLGKTKLNELRHAIALAEGFKDTRPFKDHLDTRPTCSRTDTDFMREFVIYAFHNAQRLVVSTYNDCGSWNNVPAEGFLDQGVLPLPRELSVTKVAYISGGEYLAKIHSETNGIEANMAQLTWEYCVDWACSVLVSIMDGALEELGGRISAMQEYDYLHGLREKHLAELHKCLVWDFLNGSIFENA